MSLPNLFRLKNAYKFSMVRGIILYTGAKNKFFWCTYATWEASFQ